MNKPASELEAGDVVRWRRHHEFNDLPGGDWRTNTVITMRDYPAMNGQRETRQAEFLFKAGDRTRTMAGPLWEHDETVEVLDRHRFEIEVRWNGGEAQCECGLFVEAGSALELLDQMNGHHFDVQLRLRTDDE